MASSTGTDSSAFNNRALESFDRLLAEFRTLNPTGETPRTRLRGSDELVISPVGTLSVSVASAVWSLTRSRL